MEQVKGLTGLVLVIFLLQGKSLLEGLTAGGGGGLMRRGHDQEGRVIGILINLEPTSSVISEFKEGEAKMRPPAVLCWKEAQGPEG